MTLPFVERSFVINLPERKDRRRDIRRQFERAGWNPDDPAIVYFDAVKPADPGSFPSIGARGCFMSHLGILTNAAEANLSSIAIFEDDLDFAERFNARLETTAAVLGETNWKIFYGGYETSEPPAAGGAIARAGPNLGLRTTHFICFRGEAIAKARDYLEAILTRPAGDPEGGPMHVDGAYQWFRRACPEFDCFIATPPLGVQRSSKSDVAPLKWFDRTPVVRSGVAALRRLRRRNA